MSRPPRKLVNVKKVALMEVFAQKFLPIGANARLASVGDTAKNPGAKAVARTEAAVLGLILVIVCLDSLGRIASK